MFAVSQVHIADNVHNTAGSLLGKVLILAAVTCLHVEDGNMQALRTYHAQAGVGIAQDQHGIRLSLYHQLVRSINDVAHRGAKVVAYRIHINLSVLQLQVFKENTIQVIVVVLARMRQDGVKILATFVDYRSQTDNFRAGTHNNQ